MEEAQNTAPIEAIEAETPKPNFDEFIRGIAPLLNIAALERAAGIPPKAIFFSLPRDGKKMLPIPKKHYAPILKALCLHFVQVYVIGLGVISYSLSANEFHIYNDMPFTFATHDEIKNYFQ